ncbi:cytochrome P450 [Lentinula aff. detonsa]|uniref:Cytochrome P450 n=1 Tax=Lentinula aff. detonsa TaxID=2804958 RepID=A0AA38NIU8_9AGAR|nr:cytochrome P450 [Lentinula aff. detonsa]
METSTLLILALVVALIIVYRICKSSPFSNIPGPQPKSFMLGNLRELLQQPAGLAEFEWQRTYGDVVRFRASFGTDQLMVADPKALQHVMQSSGYKWRKSPVRREIARLTSGKGLAWADGDVHTRQRKVMLPGFRAPETKFFVPFFIGCAEAEPSLETVANLTSSTYQNMYHAPRLTQLDKSLILTAAFDYDFGSTNNHENELANLYESLTANAFSAPPDIAVLMLDLFRHVHPAIMEFINDHNPKLKALHRVANVANNVASGLIAQKMEDIKGGNPNNDIMTFLVQSNMSENPKSRLTEEELLAQMRTLIFGGHETITSQFRVPSTMILTDPVLSEISRNPELQARLRAEIRAAEETIADRGETEFTMQDFEDMPILNAMAKETLRYHPVAIHLYRTAYEDDVLPLLKPIVGKDGKIISEIHIPKGAQVIGSVSAYNRNKDVFGEGRYHYAFEFNPDRWLDGRVKAEVPLGVYANLATFASGIRSCIGWRFAVTELQAFIVVLLRNFELETTPKLAKIRRESALAMVPTIEGELDKGSQLPLKVSLISKVEG